MNFLARPWRWFVGACRRFRGQWRAFIRRYDALYPPPTERRSELGRAGVAIFSFIPSFLDRLVRKADFWINRTFGGLLDRWLGIEGHPPIGLLLPAGLVCFLFLGPSGGLRGWLAIGLLVLAWLLLWWALKKVSHLDASRLESDEDSGRGRERCESEGRPRFFIPALMILVSGIVLLGWMYYPEAGKAGTSSPAMFFCIVVLLTMVGWFLDAGKRPGRQHFGSWALWVQLLVLVVVASLVWVLGEGARELRSDGGIYRHVLAPLVLALLTIPISVATIIARSIARRRVNAVGYSFRRLLQRVEIFASPTPREVDWNKAWRSQLNGVFHPLQVVFLPSLVVLVLPYTAREWLERIGCSLVILFVIVLALMWLLFSFASLHSRFDAMLGLYRRTFFSGGQIAVSVFVIVIGIARMSNLGYVTTVIDAAPLTLLTFAFVAYLVVWFNEYWLNRIIGEEYLALLDKNGCSSGRIEYHYCGDRDSSVETGGRQVQLHGGSRVVGIGRYRKNGESKTEDAFQIFGRFDLLDYLIEYSDLKDFDATFVGDGAVDREIARIKAESRDSDTDSKSDLMRRIRRYKRGRLRWHAKDLRKQFRFYTCAMNIILFGALIVFCEGLMSAPQQPAVALNTTVEDAVPLSELIFKPKPSGEVRDKVIVLAVSGGGTRAALYATSVLHGLAGVDRLDDVILASGVSGGGASLAYFAEHRAELLKAEVAGHTWKEYYRAVSAPFIVPCVRGSGEWRISSGMRLGRLLDEGFQREFSGKSGSPDLASVDGVGLIFNTGVAGENHRPEGTIKALPVWDAAHPETATSWAAGTRLVFTNLAGFPASGTERHPLGTGLRVVDAGGNVALSTAGALNANFPPVFSNAPVDVDDRRRYWVTDGGSIDNRGAITLLMALRSAIENPGPQSPGAQVPEIHVIVADASATSFGFGQKRGFGAIFGASSKLASGLIEELKSDIERQYGELGDGDGNGGTVRFHYLPMPLALRARGGLGTHWMMPLLVKFSSCTEAKPGDDDKRVLTRAQVLRLIASLHQSDAAKGSGKTARAVVDADSKMLNRFAQEDAPAAVWDWLEHDKAYAEAFRLYSDKEQGAHPGNHREAWARIVEQLEKER